MFDFSIILSNVGSCSDRYMTCGYDRPFEVEELFARVASIETVTGVELIGNAHITRDDKAIERIRSLAKQYNLKIVAIIPDHFGVPVWKQGAFTAPKADVRKAAVRETLDMADAGLALGCDLISIWNGQDGYDYPLQADYVDAQKWMAEGLAEVAQARPQVKFGLEYKPKEPRNHSFIPNVWSALALARECPTDNVGVTIDVGHSFEAYENVSEAICTAMTRDKMFHFHINDNYKAWDDDMITGSIHTIEFIEMFYWLRRLNYKGFISIDQYPYREDGRDACEQSIKWMRTFEAAAEKIDLPRMKEILAANDAVASTAYMRELIFG